MEFYYSSYPGVVGYIERMYMIWKEKGMSDVRERLLDQKWQIVTKKSMGVTEVSDKNGCEGSVGFGEEDSVVCEKWVACCVGGYLFKWRLVQ